MEDYHKVLTNEPFVPLNFVVKDEFDYSTTPEPMKVARKKDSMRLGIWNGIWNHLRKPFLNCTNGTKSRKYLHIKKKNHVVDKNRTTEIPLIMVVCERDKSVNQSDVNHKKPKQMRILMAKHSFSRNLIPRK